MTDFGLAKKTEADSGLTGTGQILGTPAYMPPEQASGKTDDVGPLADVYSLGAILYCLLTGRPPFQAASPMDTLLQVLDQDPVAPRTLNPQVPRDLETICLKCLSKESTRRYPGSETLRDEFGRFLKGEPIEARPVGRFEQGWRWCKRNPAIASLSTLAATFLLLGSVVSIYYAIEAEARADSELRARIRESEALSDAIESQKVAEENAQKASQEFQRAEQELYASKFANARIELLASKPQNALNFLQEMQKLGSVDLGWEWYYLNRVCQLERFTVAGREAAFVRGGKELATRRSPRSGIQLFDAKTGEPTGRLESNLETLGGMIASGGGELLAVTDGKKVEVWDVEQRKIRHTIDIAYETLVDFDLDVSGARLVILSGLSRASLSVPAARGSAPRKNVAVIYSMASGEQVQRFDSLSASEQPPSFRLTAKSLSRSTKETVINGLRIDLRSVSGISNRVRCSDHRSNSMQPCFRPLCSTVRTAKPWP